MVQRVDNYKEREKVVKARIQWRRDCFQLQETHSQEATEGYHNIPLWHKDYLDNWKKVDTRKALDPLPIYLKTGRKFVLPPLSTRCLWSPETIWMLISLTKAPQASTPEALLTSSYLPFLSLYIYLASIHHPMNENSFSFVLSPLYNLIVLLLRWYVSPCSNHPFKSLITEWSQVCVPCTC